MGYKLRDSYKMIEPEPFSSDVIFHPSSLNRPIAMPEINLSNSQGLTVSYNQIKNWPNKPQGHKGSKQNQCPVGLSFIAI